MQIKLDSIDSINNMDALTDSSYNGTCFAYSWFLKLKGCKYLLKILNGDKLVGFMPLFTNEDNSKIEQSTMYIPYGGFVLFNCPKGTRQKVKYIRNIENTLALYMADNYTDISFSTDPNIVDIMPFIRNGFIPELRYTYKLDLTNDIKEIYKGFGESRKQEIRKDEQLGIEFYPDKDLKYFDANKCVDWESKYGFDSSVDFVRKFIKTSIEKDKGMAFVAKKDDIIYGGVYVVWDKETAYILYTYFDKDLGIGNAFLYYNIFEYLKESKGIKYVDFEGSVYETVENYNISFGAYQCTYYNLHYSKNNMHAIFDNLYRYFDK
jgi:hypothetical protein